MIELSLLLIYFLKEQCYESFATALWKDTVGTSICKNLIDISCLTRSHTREANVSVPFLFVMLDALVALSLAQHARIQGFHSSRENVSARNILPNTDRVRFWGWHEETWAECQKRMNERARVSYLLGQLSVKINRTYFFVCARRDLRDRCWLLRASFVHRSSDEISRFSAAMLCALSQRCDPYLFVFACVSTTSIKPRLWLVLQWEPRIRKLESNRKLRRARFLRFSMIFRNSRNGAREIESLGRFARSFETCFRRCNIMRNTVASVGYFWASRKYEIFKREILEKRSC